MHFYASFPVRGQETTDSGQWPRGLWVMVNGSHVAY